MKTKSFLFVAYYYSKEGERCQAMFNNYKGAYDYLSDMLIVKNRPCGFIDGFETRGDDGFFCYCYYQILSYNEGDTCLTSDHEPMNKFTDPDEPFKN